MSLSAQPAIRGPRKTRLKRRAATPAAPPAAPPWFEPLLARISQGRRQLLLEKGDMVYSQGQKADSVFFLARGKVRLTVLSAQGREAVLGVITDGSFCGEGCLSAQALRVGSAQAVTACSGTQVEKPAMVKALHEQHPLAEAFLAQLLRRNISFEEDLCDQLFNQSEKRLARTLLKLARFGLAPSCPQGQLIHPNVSQEALAEMVGTTRSRVNFFMNKFRRLGLIEYDAEMRIHAELLTDIVLSD